jgi:hypothetical protein
VSRARPGGCCDDKQRDELAPFQLIEEHSSSVSRSTHDGISNHLLHAAGRSSMWNSRPMAFAAASI